MLITLDWPNRKMSPNARVHFRELATVKKAAREAAAWETLAQVPQEAREALAGHQGQISVSITFLEPDRRRRDLDGMLSSCKAALDGIADALRVDDYRFELSLRRGGVTAGGRVVFEIEAV